MAYKSKADAQAYQRDWYQRNRSRVIARATAYNKLHKDKVLHRYRTKYKDKYRKTKLMKIYNISSDEFDRLDAIKLCEICNKERQLTYDHDHKTGVVRGRICHSCNLGIGSLGDSADTLLEAAKYLKERSCQ